MEPLPAGIRLPPGPPRPPAPPITAGGGGGGGGFFRPGPVGAPIPGRPPTGQYAHEVLVELRKVVWPTRNETFHNATLLLGLLVLLTGLLATSDVAIANAIRALTVGG
jgi:preprotein translocase SecE subunit